MWIDIEIYEDGPFEGDHSKHTLGFSCELSEQSMAFKALFSLIKQMVDESVLDSLDAPSDALPLSTNTF